MGVNNLHTSHTLNRHSCGVNTSLIRDVNLWPSGFPLTHWVYLVEIKRARKCSKGYQFAPLSLIICSHRLHASLNNFMCSDRWSIDHLWDQHLNECITCKGVQVFFLSKTISFLDSERTQHKASPPSRYERKASYWYPQPGVKNIMHIIKWMYI